MARQLVPVAVLIGTIVAGAAGAQPATGGAGPIPVVIELYTSEGCSDCPPADRVLAELLSDQPLDGIEVIALGEHVDYWNDLGWPDRFSSGAFTRRQREYRRAVFAPTPVYTPQLVIDGHWQCIGSDRGAAEELIRRAARTGKARVRASAGRMDAGSVPVTVDVEMPVSSDPRVPVDIVVAVVEDGFVTDVRRGENRGRMLRHDAVVRSLAVVGQVPADRDSVSVSARVASADGARSTDARVVAFVQERESRRIVGAASIGLPWGDAAASEDHAQ